MKEDNNLEDTKVIDLTNTQDKVQPLDELEKTKVHQGVTTVTADWKDVAKVRNLKRPRKMKKSAKILLTILIIIFVLVAAAFCYYKFLKPESNDVYRSIIETCASKLNDYADENIKKADQPYIESGNISLTTDMETYKMLDGISFAYSIGLNPSDKTIASDFSYKEKEKDILSGNIVVKDNKIYLFSKQIYDKPLYLKDASSSIDLNDLTSKERAKDIKYLVDKTGVYFKKAMSKAKYDTKYGRILVNNKKVVVQKNYMTIDETNVATIKSDLLYSIKNDSKYIKILADLYSKETSDITKEIDELLLEDKVSDFETINFEIDTSVLTNKIVSLTVKKHDKMVVKINNVSKDKYDVNLYTNGESYLKGKLIVKSNNINFTTTMDDYKYDISFITNDDSAQFLIKVLDKGDKQIKISVKNTLEYNKKEGKIDTKKAVDTEKLSESEQETISKNFTKQLGESQVFSSFLGDITE